MIETMKVKPWGKDQGDYVLINAEDFDPAKHQKLDDEIKKESVPIRKAAAKDVKD